MFKSLLQQIGIIKEEKEVESVYKLKEIKSDEPEVKKENNIEIKSSPEKKKRRSIKIPNLFVKKQPDEIVCKKLPMNILLKRLLTIPEIERDFGIPRRTFNHYVQKEVIKPHGVIGGAEIYDYYEVDKLPHIGNSYTFAEAQQKYGVTRVRIMTAINNRKLKIAEYQLEKNRRLFQKDIENWIRKYGIDKDDLHVEKKGE